MLVTFNSRTKNPTSNNDNENTANRINLNSNGPTTKVKHEHTTNMTPFVNTTKPSVSTSTTNSKVSKPIHNKSTSNSTTTPSISISNSNINRINNSSDFHLFKENSRSKLGCLTCKIRKKKCDESKPKCGDCNRLNKNCYYIDYHNMNNEEIKELKKKVENEESSNKLRKRKIKSKPIKIEDEKDKRSPNIHLNSNLKNGMFNNIGITSVNEDNKSKVYGYVSDVRSTTSGTISDSSTNTTNYQSTNTSAIPSSTTPNLTSIHPISQVTSPIRMNSPTIQSLMNPMEETQTSEIQETNNLSTNPIHRITHTEPLVQEKDLQNCLPESSPLPLTTIDPLHDFSIKGSNSFPVNSPSPMAFLNLLRDLNESNGNNCNNTYKHRSSNQLEETEGNDDGTEQSYSQELRQFISSPDFSSMVESFDDNSHNSHSYNELISNLNAHLTPMPQASLYIPELADPQYYFLYYYYVDVVSSKISVAPVTQIGSNSYQKVFLPLAHKDKGVFYSILAWASYQLGGEWSSEAIKFVKVAMYHFNNSKENNRTSIINKLATLLILCGAEICNGDVKNWTIYLEWGAKLLKTNGGILKFNKSKEENWLITNFAYHDLLASSTSERGTYFAANEYDKIFDDHDNFLQGQIHSLLGVSKRLFTIIGNISTLLYESKKILKEYYTRGVNNHFEQSNEYLNKFDDEDILQNGNEGDDESIMSDHTKASKLLLIVIDQAKNLEKEIDESKPDKNNLYNLSDQDLELQLTLFEAFQISAKLFLRESVLKCNPSHLESQILNNDLIKCLDILIGTSVQSSLVFPIFISGIHCVSKHDKEQMILRVDSFIKLYGMFNANRVKEFMLRIWDLNSNGDKVVDWHEMLKELGWDINFA
ncbi:uncharacterized protein KGF55_003886 [Candida pseudojiufengensis]|uniref:uncharacterized protein n=1 Tax=Candida pseudojiufengensis TaxID=497109 RepID=UPI0022255315|nr:uncharacterized protein KGF55_003886 [Candida pseudojiufengensis]KAI5961915.1 hypothetical protein KGF55_003886 [Candida pseudojiufengensis]